MKGFPCCKILFYCLNIDIITQTLFMRNKQEVRTAGVFSFYNDRQSKKNESSVKSLHHCDNSNP